MLRALMVSVCLLAFSTLPAEAESATFHPISGPTGTSITGLSSDGSVAIGNTGSAGAFRWPIGGTVELIGLFVAYGTNADGTVVVGEDWSAIRWSAETGMVALPTLYGMEAFGMATCAAGDHVVGRTPWDPIYRDTEGFTWNAVDGTVGLGFLTDDGVSGATDICADGSTVVGWSGLDAVRWTATGGIETIGSGGAAAISADGKVIVGRMYTGTVYAAFRWTAETGQVPLDPAGSVTRALDVSGDGSVIVGKGGFNFIWDKTHGIRSPNDVLTIDYGMDTTADEIVSLSADAKTLAVGNGVFKLRFAPHFSPWLGYDWGKVLVSWPPVSGALSSNVYRGDLDQLVDADGDGLPDTGYGDCMNHLDVSSGGVYDSKFPDQQVPEPGAGFFYVIGYEAADGPRALGWTSAGKAREVELSCP